MKVDNCPFPLDCGNRCLFTFSEQCPALWWSFDREMVKLDAVNKHGAGVLEKLDRLIRGVPK